MEDELKLEVTEQLENFLNLLVDLDIIDPPTPSDARDYRLGGGGEEMASLILHQFGSNQASESSNVVPVGEIPCFESPAYTETSPTLDQNAIESPQLPTLILSSSIPYSPPVPASSVDQLIAFQKLQDILVGDELTSIQQNLTKLEHQIYNPQELINLLLPSVTELLRLKVTDSKEEFVQAITPIVDRAIQSRVEQDRNSMGLALASVVPLAISQQIRDAPEEVAAAIAPTMARAMKKQIEIEQDSIVDALYPIIGSTIAKYMAQTITAINQQVEETLSVNGIKRKIRAKLQGVSEAELILAEASPFAIQAIFLIHKTSGLVICDIQPSDGQLLESEMIAGMLTAIRSFANDCINQSGSVSELDAIDYGTSKIILEVAGYCYLAIVVQGKPSKTFILKTQQSLSKLVKDYGKYIEQFDGDPETIPPQVHTILEILKENEVQAKKKTSQPSPLLILSLTVVSAILIPLGIWQYHSRVIRSIEEKTAVALASTPELAVYRLTVKGDRDTLKLTGKVPNQVLRFHAEQIAKETAPKWSIDNQILSVEVPADPVLAAAEVKRVVAVLNQIDGTVISAKYFAAKVSIEGTVSRVAEVQTIQKAFEQIPGVKFVSSAVQVKPLQFEVRFYFETNSAMLIPADLTKKIQQVMSLLNQHPVAHLKIIGYSYSSANFSDQRLAIWRAKAVQQKLLERGIDPSRLQIIRQKSFPPGIDVNQPSWLSRCVVLEISPNS